MVGVYSWFCYICVCTQNSWCLELPLLEVLDRSSFGFCIIFVSLMIYKDPKKINIWIKELNWMIPFLELIIRSISRFLREIEEQKINYIIKCLNRSAIPVTIMEFWRVDGQRSIPRTAQYPGSGQEVSQSSKSTTPTVTSPYDTDSAGCFPVFLPQVRIKKP